MKRLLSIILAFVVVFSFCACGAAVPAPEPTPNPAEVLYEKYSDIIDALEAEDYEAAVEKIGALAPQPEYEEIVITPENFWDFFEYREEFERRVDSFGEVQTDYSRISSGFILKEEYDNRLADTSSVAIAYYAEGYMEVAKIDEENHSFEWTGITTDSPFNGDDAPEKERDTSLTFVPGRINLGNLVASSGHSGSVVYFRRLQNIQITKAEGALYLKQAD